MKKVLCILLIFSMAVCFIACNDNSSNSTNNEPQTPKEVTLTRNNYLRYVDVSITYGDTTYERTSLGVITYKSHIYINVTPKKAGVYEDFCICFEDLNLPVGWMVDGDFSRYDENELSIPYTGILSKEIYIYDYYFTDTSNEPTDLPEKATYKITSVQGVFRPT